jgi:hypothetical protein
VIENNRAGVRFQVPDAGKQVFDPRADLRCPKLRACGGHSDSLLTTSVLLLFKNEGDSGDVDEKKGEVSGVSEQVRGRG